MLVVDDDPDFSDVTEAILTGAGYRVARSTNGRQGLAAVHSLGPDAIVTDVMMPEMDGLLFLSALPRDHVPVVVMSGIAFGSEARARGAVAFLRKPFLAKDLLAAIATIRDAPPRRTVNV